MVVDLNLYRSSSAFTHVSLEPPSKYEIPIYELDKVYDELPHINSLCESPTNNTNVPWLVDVDLKIESDTIQPLYTRLDVQRLIGYMNTIFRNNTRQVQPQGHVVCVLTKPPRKDGEYIKHGLHIHMPYFYMKKADIKHFNKQLAKSVSADSNLFSAVQFKRDTIIDDVATKVWLLYASSKSESSGVYTLDSSFDIITGKELTLHETFPFLYDNTNKTRISTENFTTEQFHKHMARLLSIFEHGHESDVYKRFHESIVEPSISKETVTRMDVDTTLEEDEEDEDDNPKLTIKAFTSTILLRENDECKQLLALLSPKRVESNEEWITIGFYLWTITNGHDSGFKLWMDWSSTRSNWNIKTKYTIRSAYKRWKSMKQGFTKAHAFRKLRYKAMEDSPTQYRQIIETRDWIDSIELSECYIVQELNQLYKGRFICTCIRFDNWFEFKNGLWVEVEKGYTFRNTITTEFCTHLDTKITELEQYIMDIKDMYDESDDKRRYLIERYMNKVKILAQIRAMCRRTASLNAIMSEARGKFLDGEFFNKLDQNADLFAFQNGVLDLKTGEIREGLPTDYISLRGGVSLEEPTDEEYELFNSHFQKIFPDDEIRQYFFDLFCRIFVGGNEWKHLYFWSGDHGNNGKSVTQTIFSTMMGNYAKEVPVSLFTKRTGSSNSVSPEQERIGTCRWVCANEPERGEELNIGLLKARTGNDVYFARKLFDNGRDIKPMFKIVIICNNPPRATAGDQAFWNRVVVVPFEAEFVHDAPDTIEEQIRLKKFKMDTEFRHKIPTIAKVLAWHLVQVYRKNKGAMPIPPLKIVEQVKKFRTDNDIIMEFIKVKIVDDELGTLSFEDLLAALASYNQSEGMGVTVQKRFARSYLEHAWGALDENGLWFGRRLK